MSTTRRLAPADAAFVYGETREAPQHVGTLMRFTPPAEPARATCGRCSRRSARRCRSSRRGTASWRRRGCRTTPCTRGCQTESFDLDYHVRRTAVPGTGRRARARHPRRTGCTPAPLDLTKPPWELHVVEGLKDGAFAMFVKVHHSLVDGYTMTRTLELAFTPEPDDGPPRLFCNVPLDAAAGRPAAPAVGRPGQRARAARSPTRAPWSPSPAPSAAWRCAARHWSAPSTRRTPSSTGASPGTAGSPRSGPPRPAQAPGQGERHDPQRRRPRRLRRRTAHLPARARRAARPPPRRVRPGQRAAQGRPGRQRRGRHAGLARHPPRRPGRAAPGRARLDDARQAAARGDDEGRRHGLLAGPARPERAAGAQRDERPCRAGAGGPSTSPSPTSQALPARCGSAGHAWRRRTRRRSSPTAWP